jgi:hypothetical protein
MTSARARSRSYPQTAHPAANWLTFEPQLGHLLIGRAMQLRLGAQGGGDRRGDFARLLT